MHIVIMNSEIRIDIRFEETAMNLNCFNTFFKISCIFQQEQFSYERLLNIFSPLYEERTDLCIVVWDFFTDAILWFHCVKHYIFHYSNNKAKHNDRINDIDKWVVEIKKALRSRYFWSLHNFWTVAHWKIFSLRSLFQVEMILSSLYDHYF